MYTRRSFPRQDITEWLRYEMVEICGAIQLPELFGIHVWKYFPRDASLWAVCGWAILNSYQSTSHGASRSSIVRFWLSGYNGSTAVARLLPSYAPDFQYLIYRKLNTQSWSWWRVQEVRLFWNRQLYGDVMGQQRIVLTLHKSFFMIKRIISEKEKNRQAKIERGKACAVNQVANCTGSTRLTLYHFEIGKELPLISSLVYHKKGDALFRRSYVN